MNDTKGTDTSVRVGDVAAGLGTQGLLDRARRSLGTGAPVHARVAAALGRQAWTVLGPQERIRSVHSVFESACQENGDALAAELVVELKGALYAQYVDCSSPLPMYVFQYLRTVYESVMRGMDPHRSRMAATRQALFQAVLGLWKGEDHEEASVAAFEWCCAVANPMLGCEAEHTEWTSAMKTCRWALIGDERQVMVDWMEGRCKDSLLPVDSIDWWLEKYATVPDFPKNVFVILVAAQARKGGIDLVRSRISARRTCAALAASDSSRGAWEFCQDIAEEVAAFDEEVRKKVIAPIIAGHEALFIGSGYFGNIALRYSKDSIGSHVSITVMLPKELPLGFVEEMRVRIHLHTFNFFMEKRSRKVYARLTYFGCIEVERWDFAEPSFENDGRDDD
ncbi:MAG: hypothetical protein Q7R63_02555 [bacterium]|nr:hypothetical protein [bacterium]